MCNVFPLPLLLPSPPRLRLLCKLSCSGDVVWACHTCDEPASPGKECVTCRPSSDVPFMRRTKWYGSGSTMIGCLVQFRLLANSLEIISALKAHEREVRARNRDETREHPIRNSLPFIPAPVLRAPSQLDQKRGIVSTLKSI